MKHLPKHLRPRWRYFAVEVTSFPDAEITRGEFQREVWYAAQNLIGDAGSADADMTVLDFEFDDGVGETVVRVRHGHTDSARAAITCVDAVNGQNVGVRVRGTSGTVRTCEERYLGRASGETEERRVVFEDDRRSALVRDDVAAVRTSTGFLGATELDFE